MTTWRTELLRYIAAPKSSANLTALALWAQSEGMPAWENNPLACGTTHPGSYAVNADGVQAYPTVIVGADVIGWTLLRAPYTAISAALISDAGMPAVYLAVNASTWCKGCQSGHYPVALYQAIGSPATATLTSVITLPSGAIAAPSTVQAAWETLRTYTSTSGPTQVRQWGELADAVAATGRGVLV